MVLKAYLYNENIFHINLLYPLQIMAIFCGQTFLVMLQRHNFLCGKKKQTSPVVFSTFNMPIFLNLAEGNDRSGQRHSFLVLKAV